MYKNVFFVIFIQLLLWQMCLSLHECNRTINGNAMTFICPSSINSQELRLYDLTVAQLDNIVSLVAKGGEGAFIGPFTRIPANVCLLRNLQSIDFSYNQMIDVDPTGSLSTCVSNIVTLDVSFNRINNFPSVMIYNMPRLKNLYFQHNQLIDIPVTAFSNISSLEIIDFSYNILTTFELWALEVKTKADFRNNQISTITNKYIFNKVLPRVMEDGAYLDNNSATINFTDAVYEMYNQCNEVKQWYFSLTPDLDLPTFTWKLSSINFGSSRISCSCDQVYFLRILVDTQYGNSRNLQIETALCGNNSLKVSDVYFINSSCVASLFPVNSSVNFTQVYPRLCKISEDDDGLLTTVPDSVPPSLNVSTYPYYVTVLMNPGACYFSFSNTTSMSIHCTNETSNSISSIPTSLLTSSYMSNINSITFLTSISSLPSYLCSLPSLQIDLSYQAFTTLTDETFPCLDSFNTIKLANNQITSVSMSNGNFTKLNSLDLSSNQLKFLPYSLLNPTPTSLRYLDLRNNSINYIDLFIYTLKDISINLDNNPINTSVIINPQNVTLENNGNSTSNITLPIISQNSTVIITDVIAVTYGLCNNFQSLRTSLLNLKSALNNVFIKCTCESINLRDIYTNNGYNLKNDFNCSNSSDESNFYLLSTSSCQNATNFQAGLCANKTQSTSGLGATNAGSSGTPVGLILGLTLGLGCPLILIGGLASGIYVYNRKNASPPSRKPVKRMGTVGQAGDDPLGRHMKPRSFRSVKLAPLQSSRNLPPIPVATVLPPSKSKELSLSSTNLRSTNKGIPLGLNSVSSPTHVNLQYRATSNGFSNDSNIRSSNNLSLSQGPTSEQRPQPPKLQPPSVNPVLNAGGDPRYQ